MADVQLKLQASLDLAFLRNQLSTIGTQLSGQSLTVGIKIDRAKIASEYHLLNRYFGNKTFRASIETNIKNELDYADKLHRKLLALNAARPKNLASEAATGRPGGFINEAEFSRFLNRLKKAPLEAVRNAMQTAGVQMAGVGKNTVAELRQSILSGLPQLSEDMASGLMKSLDPAMKESGSKGAKSLIDGFKTAAGIASPSRVFKQLGEFSADGLEIGFLNGLKSFGSKAIAEVRKIAALMRLELAAVGNVPISASIQRGSGARGGRQYFSPIGPLPHGSREPWAYSQEAFRYEPRMAQPGQFRGAGIRPMVSRFPFAEAPSVMGTITSPGMFGMTRPALPAAGMTGAGDMRQARINARIAAAYARSAARGASVMGESQMYATVAGRVPLGNPAPRLPPGNKGGALALRDAGAQTPLSLDYYKNAFKYAEALKVAQASAKNFTAASIPLIGGLRGIIGEFGEATKQVLLYGAAYKGLAFIMSLPGQILNAAKSQQQYSNALQTATQDTGTFAKELLYVDNVQRAFGLNLETTRAGFVRLYASMAPTGFDSGSIEKLFTGISAATAALQLTPDKAERVIYAFGQMASKGQIMSEELKGQLGDVLPGALAIFAKAAGMSVKDFSKAMEDGVFVGGKFREVFAKVSDELMNRFGTGAQAAGKSLQGLLNTVGGDFQRTLESFAPLANAAAQAVLGPLGGALKQLSMSAQIATGEIERTFMQLKEAQKDLGDLRAGGADAKELRAAEQNVAALTARYRTLQSAAQDPAIAKQAQDIQLFTQELAKAGTFVMNVAKAIGSALSPILNVLGTNLTTVIGLITSFYIGFQTARLAAMALMGVLLAYRTISTILGFSTAANQATALAGAFNVLGVAATRATTQAVGLRFALTALVASTVIGAVVGGIIAIASAFATMKDRAKEAAEESKRAVEEGGRAASMGMTMGVTSELNKELAKNRAVSQALKTLENIYARNQKSMRGGGKPIISAEEMARLKAGAEYSNEIAGIISDNQLKKDGFQINLFLGPDLERARRQAGQITAEVRKSTIVLRAQQRQAQQVAKEIGLDKPTSDATIPDGPNEKELEKRRNAAESAAENARKLADDRHKYESDLMKLSAAQAIELDDAAFDHWKSLQSLKYDLMEAGQNEWMSREIKFQRDLQAIEIRRLETIRQARKETFKAESEAQASAYVTGGGGGPGGVTGLLQGSTGVSSGPHFDVRRADGGPISEAEARALFDQRVRRQLQMTSGYGPRNTGIPGASTFHRGIDLAGPANTPLNLAPGYTLQSAGMAGGLGYAANVRGPQGQMYQVGHLQQPQGKLPFSRQRAEAKQDYASAIASQETINAKEREQIANRQANIRAQQELNVLVKEYVASIAPVEQQKLENSLLQERIKLVSSGLFGEALDTQQKIAEVEMRRTLGVKASTQAIQDNQAEISKNNEAVKAGTKTQSLANAENAIYAQGIATNTQKINELNQATKDYIPTLQEKLRLTQQSAEAELQSAIQRATPLGGMGLSAGFIGDAATKYEEAIGRGASKETATAFAEAQNQLTLLETRNNAIKSSVLAIGDAFGTAMTTGVASLIDGTASAEEVFANFLKSIGQALLQAAAQMIATYIAIGIARIFAGLGGGGKSADTGGFAGMTVPNNAVGEAMTFQMMSFAKGGIAPKGFQAFATGGIVTGPTLGLVGEGRYNEAVVPLPDGKSIPVDLSGNGAQGGVNVVVNVDAKGTQVEGKEDESRQLGRLISAAVQSELVKQQRPGGLLAGRR